MESRGFLCTIMRFNENFIDKKSDINAFCRSFSKSLINSKKIF